MNKLNSRLLIALTLNLEKNVNSNVKWRSLDTFRSEIFHGQNLGVLGDPI
jgi:hypothetical protein